MDAKDFIAVREDFLAWSGGFPPDSEQTIFMFLEYAIRIDIDDVDGARKMLRQWMALSGSTPLTAH
jgi:hypothetical protein